MPIAPASAACGGRNCIPQPNSPLTLDSLADRLMFRLAYRNYIDHESLVISHSVDPGITGVVSGVRWYEFRISGQPNAVCSTYPCTYQQGTIADAPNGRSRWMPSISQDGAENILVGYSTTGTLEATDAHSIRYTGRAKDRPLGTMTVPETVIVTGNRNEVADPALGLLPGRWGDYTSTSIDPADDCTFWHVNQYYRQGQGANTNFDWSTRVASASFSAAQCQPRPYESSHQRARHWHRRRDRAQPNRDHVDCSSARPWQLRDRAQERHSQQPGLVSAARICVRLCDELHR